MMPQLDSASYLSQAFWLLVCFCLLWALIANFITPKLTEVIEERKRKINDYIQKAEKLNNQAKATLNRYDEIMLQAQNSAEQKLAAGKQAIKIELNETQQKMQDALSKEIAEKRKTLFKENKQTAKQIDAISQDIALSIVHKLGFSQISAQDILRASQHPEKDDG